MKISATIINAENITAVTTKGTSWNMILIEADIAPKSAPILILLAIISRLDIGYTTLVEYFFFIKAAKPFPLKRPIRAHISCITIIVGNRNSIIHSIPRPNFAPTWEYVAISDGSSSAAPVIRPGPNALIIWDIDFIRTLLNGAKSESGLESCFFSTGKLKSDLLYVYMYLVF